VAVGGWTAPALAISSRFGTEGSGAGQISGEPAGVAVNQGTGDVLISDRNNSRIDKFGGEGEFMLAWGWGVADGSTEALQTCTTTCFGGHERPPFDGPGQGQFSNVEGIAVDNSLGASNGDVYVIDSGNHRVQKFGPEGEFILMFGREVNAATNGDVCLAGEECQAGGQGTGPGEFEGLAGRAIAVDVTGTVYVGDENRVQLFSPAGAVEGAIPLPGVGHIENLVVDAAKDIYVAGGSLTGVHKYNETGVELGVPRDEAGEAVRLTLAIGPSDELFVNDFEQGRHHILSFDSVGKQTASFDAGGPGEDGQRGIAYGEGLGVLYILNEGTTRVVTPPAAGPLLLAGSEVVSEVQPTTATVGATINPEGSTSVTYHFEYGTTTGYGASTPPTPLEGGEFADQGVSAALTGLEPRTAYHFRAVVTDGTHTVLGPDATFITLPPVSIDGTSASQVNATSARLEAELNPHGVATQYHFEYDVVPYADGEGSHGTAIPIPDASAGAGVLDTTVSALVQGLLPATTYHYRVVAHNALGTVVGPDRFFTSQGPSSILADGRTWELVSPPNKHGAPLEPLTEEGGLIQAASGGGGLAYVSLGPVNGEPEGVRSPQDSQLLAIRSASGWSTQDITTPRERIAIVQVGSPSEYKFFSDELNASVVEPQGSTALSTETTERTPYLREVSGAFAPLVTASNVPTGTKFGGVEETPGTGQFSDGVAFRTATPDLSRVLLESPQLLSQDFAPGFEPTGLVNLYELVNRAPQLISVLPDGRPASEEGVSASVGANSNLRGAVSNDGERVVFETHAGEGLYTRDLGLGQTVRLNEVQPGASGEFESGNAVFQAANDDGSKVFFTDTRRLTVDATAQPVKPDLYMCEVVLAEGHLSCRLSDLTVDHTPGQAANVARQVSAIDDTGEHVYFAASGVLTSTSNTRGEHAQPGECESETEGRCNLYEYNTASHQVSLVAVLSSADSPDWGGAGAGVENLHVLGNLTARSSPNGRYFTFMSQQSLTGYDSRDVHSGRPDAEVFLLDTASGALHCTSCNPTGGRPAGVFDERQFPGLLVDHPSSWGNKWIAGSIPGWTLGPSHLLALYQSRYLSNSGREFFNSSDALVPQDTNNVNDVYEFEPPGVGDCTSSSRTFSASSGGCVNLISSGGSQEESAFLDASESGDEVFFLTAARLVNSDVDSALDVYDAHVCTSSSPCPPPTTQQPPTCEGDSCQNPSSPPGESTPSSLTYKGPQNPPPPAPGKAKAPSRAQLLAKALHSCRKKKNKHKRQSCERQARKRYGVKKASAKKKAKKTAQHAKGRAGR